MEERCFGPEQARLNIRTQQANSSVFAEIWLSKGRVSLFSHSSFYCYQICYQKEVFSLPNQSNSWMSLKTSIILHWNDCYRKFEGVPANSGNENAQDRWRYGAVGLTISLAEFVGSVTNQKLRSPCLISLWIYEVRRQQDFSLVPSNHVWCSSRVGEDILFGLLWRNVYNDGAHHIVCSVWPFRWRLPSTFWKVGKFFYFNQQPPCLL